MICYLILENQNGKKQIYCPAIDMNVVFTCKYNHKEFSPTWNFLDVLTYSCDPLSQCLEKTCVNYNFYTITQSIYIQIFCILV